MGRLVFILVLGFSLAAGAACRPDAETCDYYQCLSAELGCGSSHYLTRFAGRYCQAYLENADLFSQTARTWLQQVRLCLQSELNDVSASSCSAAARAGWASHFNCYDSLGFCDLPRADKISIVWMERKALWEPRSWIFAEHLSRCL